MRRWLGLWGCWVTVAVGQPVVTLDIYTELEDINPVIYAEFVHKVVSTIRQPVELRVFQSRIEWIRQQGVRKTAALITYGVWPGADQYDWTPWGSQTDQLIVLVPEASLLQKLEDLAGRLMLGNPANWSSLVLKSIWPTTLPPPNLGGGQGMSDEQLLAHFAQWGGREAIGVPAKLLAGTIPRGLRVLFLSPAKPDWWIGYSRTMPRATQAKLAPILAVLPVISAPDSKDRSHLSYSTSWHQSTTTSFSKVGTSVSIR